MTTYQNAQSDFEVDVLSRQLRLLIRDIKLCRPVHIVNKQPACLEASLRSKSLRDSLKNLSASAFGILVRTAGTAILQSPSITRRLLVCTAAASIVHRHSARLSQSRRPRRIHLKTALHNLIHRLQQPFRVGQCQVGWRGEAFLMRFGVDFMQVVEGVG